MPKQTNTAKNVARQFTDSDWEGLSGATSWESDLPILREFTDCMVIADANGVELIDENADSFCLPGVVFPTQYAAVAFLNGLDETFTKYMARTLYGFEAR